MNRSELKQYKDIFKKNIIIGENHTHDAPVKWLIAHAKYLKAKGYKYCFVEGIAKGKVWDKGGKITDKYHERPSCNEAELYDVLTKCGIRVVGMDVWKDKRQSKEKFKKEKKKNIERLLKDPNWRLGHNKDMIETINKYSKNGKEKYIGLCGSAHVFDKKFIKKYVDDRVTIDDHVGLGELPNTISLFPYDTDTNDITLRCGYGYHNHKLHKNDNSVSIKIGLDASIDDVRNLYKEARKLRSDKENNKDAKQVKKHRQKLDSLCKSNIKKFKCIVTKVQKLMEKHHDIILSKKDVKSIFTHYGVNKSKAPTGSRRFSSLFQKQCKKEGLLFETHHGMRVKSVMSFLKRNKSDIKTAIGL